MKLALLLLGTLMMTPACTSTQPSDPFQYLEEVRGKDSIQWVTQQNNRTLSALEEMPNYKALHQEIRALLLAQDRIPEPTQRGEYIYNFWQDQAHVRGIWRRAKIQDYMTHKVEWETVLDLDVLSKAEGETWVWHGAHCLPPQFQTCLVSLSKGGKDASVVREFNLQTKSFLSGGFELPEAKSSVDWLNGDTLILGADLGPDSLTASGYPRQLRLWSRGQPYQDSLVIFEGEKDDVSVWAVTSHDPEYPQRTVLGRSTSFFTALHFLFDPNNPKATHPIPVPDHAQLVGIYQDQALFLLRKAWSSKVQAFPAGSLIRLSLSESHAPLKTAAVLVYSPNPGTKIENVTTTKDGIYLSLLIDASSHLLRSASLIDPSWEKVGLPDHGSIRIQSADEFSSSVWIQFENFLTPPTQAWIKDIQASPKNIRAIPHRFNSKGLKVTRHRAKSADGTEVPYFQISQPKATGPSLVYGYGGFEVSMTPKYSGAVGKAWLEKGGTYILTNIRGGGEFGPSWHQAALKENRQRAFDDFAAVIRDLHKRGIATPQSTAIMGGSNGGLLVGATVTQAPELMKAAVCQVPLLDMLRFHRLLAGHSWTAEYGSPDQPNEAEYLRKYSPYHQLGTKSHYPKVFFVTSTADDRVHPGHARKMAAKMESLGIPFDYYENMEGGHGGGADLEQTARRIALEYTFLFRELRP